MRRLVERQKVECESRGTERYGRTLALCKVGGRDIGAEMVAEGMAWAFVRYSRDYALQEGEARAANIGVHAHGCEPAWEWRSRQRISR